MTKTSSFFLLTAFGQDRPGIVAEITGIVFRLGGNIEDASMTRLGGEFVTMLVVALPSTRAGERLTQHLPALQKKLQLNLNLKPLTRRLAHVKHHSPATHLISVYGTDRPGIVYRTAQALADQRINITDLNTKILERPGKPLYVMLLEVQIPSQARAAALRRTLQRLGRSLGLNATLQEIEPVSM